jgi:toxin-antitoxin system PIN domain toxin
MTYLLDASVLIALCDELHAHHNSAYRWFTASRKLSWATCPLTENAFLRITSHPSYPRSTGSVTEQSRVLRELCALPDHQFWPDGVSLLQDDIWLQMDHVKPSDLTDLYLLALAVKRGGQFVTLDRSVPTHRIRGGKEALQVISA